MKKFILALFIATLAIAGLAQTNQWYDKGDLNISVVPTAFFPMASAKPSKAQYGFSYETMYWATASTGAGLEFGKRDLAQANDGYIDHFTAVVAYRIVPFPTLPVLGRWSLAMRSGAQTFISSGAKGTLLGLESDYALTRSIFVFAGAEENFETTAENSGLSLNGGLKWRF
jgi:hypothetical protein